MMSVGKIHFCNDRLLGSSSLKCIYFFYSGLDSAGLVLTVFLIFSIATEGTLQII